MEFDEIVVKESPGLCRCCLSEGCYKDLGTEYTWMNENEVYADMLLECFDISISQHNEGPNGPNRLICEVCITRLRDACNFKKQVLDSEKKFVDMIGRGEFRPKVLIYQSQMKSEAHEETAGEDIEVEYLDDVDFGDDDQPLKNEASASDIAVALPAPKRGRPRKGLKGLKADKKRPKLDERPKTSKALVKGKASATVVDKPVIRVRSMDVLLAKCDTEQKKLETTTTNTQAKLKNSIISLILNTTVCPFKFCRFYICIYCPSRFVSMPELEQHVKLKHKHLTEMDVRKAITKVGTRDPVKVNVTEYGCKLCDDQIFHFEHLKHHLINKHNEPVDIYNDGVFLFNITNEFGCALCGIKLENYLFLCKHMNEHYDKFSCFQCGAVFASVFRLKRHQLSHEEGYYPCDECGKVFSNSESRQTHIQTVHMKMKRNKCMYCEASFKEYIQKQKHLFAAHGIKQREYKCTYCPKVFNKSSGMRSHERQIHVKGQAFPCELCEYNCYDKNKLRRHMICHTGERKYTCQFCGKSYARPSTLNGHVRIHNNDRRHKCEYCDKAFVQKCSLQGHIRTHHKDVQM